MILGWYVSELEGNEVFAKGGAINAIYRVQLQLQRETQQ